MSDLLEDLAKLGDWLEAETGAELRCAEVIPTVEVRQRQRWNGRIVGSIAAVCVIVVGVFTVRDGSDQVLQPALPSSTTAVVAEPTPATQPSVARTFPSRESDIPFRSFDVSEVRTGPEPHRDDASTVAFLQVDGREPIATFKSTVAGSPAVCATGASGVGQCFSETGTAVGARVFLSGSPEQLSLIWIGLENQSTVDVLLPDDQILTAQSVERTVYLPLDGLSPGDTVVVALTPPDRAYADPENPVKKLVVDDPAALDTTAYERAFDNELLLTLDGFDYAGGANDDRVGLASGRSAQPHLIVTGPGGLAERSAIHLELLADTSFDDFESKPPVEPVEVNGVVLRKRVDDTLVVFRDTPAGVIVARGLDLGDGPYDGDLRPFEEQMMEIVAAAEVDSESILLQGLGRERIVDSRRLADTWAHGFGVEAIIDPAPIRYRRESDGYDEAIFELQRAGMEFQVVDATESGALMGRDPILLTAAPETSRTLMWRDQSGEGHHRITWNLPELGVETLIQAIRFVPLAEFADLHPEQSTGMALTEDWLRATPLPEGADVRTLVDRLQHTAAYRPLQAARVTGGIACLWVEAWHEAVLADDPLRADLALVALLGAQSWPSNQEGVLGSGPAARDATDFVYWVDIARSGEIDPGSGLSMPAAFGRSESCPVMG